MKTKEQIKDELAKSKGYRDAEHWLNDQPNYKIESCLDEVCDAYAGQEAVEFADWLEQKAYSNDGNWYLHNSMSGEIYTTKELFQIFANEKKKV